MAQNQFICHLHHDQHDGVDAGIIMKVVALDAGLFEQSICTAERNKLTKFLK